MLVCTVYAMHLHSAAMEDNKSYMATMDRCNTKFVPSSCFKCEIKCTDHKVAERDRCSHAHVAEAEVKTLKEDLQRL